MVVLRRVVVSLMILNKPLSYSCLSKITTPLPLSGRNITMFLFSLSSFSVTAQRSIRKLANRLCKPIDIRLVFTTFKVRNLFNVKDAVPVGLRTRVVYKFSCASCNAC